MYKVVDGQPLLDLDVGYVTVPALMATVALAGHDPRMVGDPSVVRPGTGLQLVTTKAAFDAKLALEQAATEGTEVSGFTVDRLDLRPWTAGSRSTAQGTRPAPTPRSTGEVIARYEGGTDGHLHIIPAVQTDVDLDTWVVCSAPSASCSSRSSAWSPSTCWCGGPRPPAPARSTSAAGQVTQPLVHIGD